MSIFTMILLLAFLYASFAHGSPHRSIPYPEYSRHPSGSQFSGIFEAANGQLGPDTGSAQDTRSVLDIVWSCLATIFACTWVSIHPNIPHPDTTEWQIRKHRAVLMLWSLIAPELIVLWAMRQWIGARDCVERLKQYGFGMTHGHFLQMGGFMLYHGERHIGIFSFWQFRQLLTPSQTEFQYHDHVVRKGDILFKMPSEEAIQDRSKGDGLSKALAVGQTTWFLVQCIGRWARGLLVTELELATLAFAALNAVVYFLWWHKPVDVRFGIPVIWNPTDDALIEESHQTVFCEDSHDHVIIEEIDSQSGDSIQPPASVGELSIEEVPSANEAPGILPSPDTHNSSGAHVASSRVKVESVVKEEVVEVSSSPTPITPKPFWKRARSMVNFWRLKFFAEKDDDGQVSIYNAMTRSSASDFTALCVASFVAVVFGGIHCIAWDFDHTFPTSAERILWRACAAAITAIPVILLLRSIARYRLEAGPSEHWDEPHPIMDLFFWVSILLAPLYVIARVGLLVEACIALRSLHPLALADLQWVNFLPHI